MPMNRSKYPDDWEQISQYIRFERAEGRCECTGQCGDHHGLRCNAPHLVVVGRLKRMPSVWLPWEQIDELEYGAYDQVRIVLTTAHLDHDPMNSDGKNLLAACQQCHLRYDAQHHAATAAKNRRRKLTEAGQGELDLMEAKK